MTTPDPAGAPFRYLAVAPSTSPTADGVGNLGVQTYVDQGDGNGPQLVTLFFQIAGVFPVDENGNPLQQDDARGAEEWRRTLLDEVRALRIGIERLLENRPKIAETDQSLLEEAQSLRLDQDDLNNGRYAAENPEGSLPVTS